MNRISILNELIKKHGFKKFCEIGVRGGDCLNGVQCDYKVGVDPDLSSAATIFETSDEFFSKLNEKFDIYWIDGLHHADQAERDIINALNNLNEGGFVCGHDNLPTSEFMTLIPQRPDHCEWCGDVYKAFIKLRMERDDLTFHVVDTDWGCSIITKNKEGVKTEKLKIDCEINYENFLKNRNNWMNVISVEEFKSLYL